MPRNVPKRFIIRSLGFRRMNSIGEYTYFDMKEIKKMLSQLKNSATDEKVKLTYLNKLVAISRADDYSAIHTGSNDRYFDKNFGVVHILRNQGGGGGFSNDCV